MRATIVATLLTLTATACAQRQPEATLTLPDGTPLAPSAVAAGTGTIYFDFQVDTAAVPRPGNPAPEYPAELRIRGTTGEVLAQFVVDEDGRAQPESFKVLKATHAEFVEPVRRVLPQWRFRPAQKGGVTVKQLVQMPFTFQLADASR